MHTYNLDFQSQASYGHEPHTCKNPGQRSVGSKPKLKRRTNGRTRAIASLCGKGGNVNVTAAEWQITLCGDPIWYVSYRGSEALRTAIRRLLYSI